MSEEFIFDVSDEPEYNVEEDINRYEAMMARNLPPQGPEETRLHHPPMVPQPRVEPAQLNAPSSEVWFDWLASYMESRHEVPVVSTATETPVGVRGVIPGFEEFAAPPPPVGPPPLGAIPPPRYQMALQGADDIAVRTTARANLFLYGDATTLPVYRRIFESPGPKHKRAMIRYVFTQASYRSVVDQANVAILSARLTFEDITRLIHTAFVFETQQRFPGYTTYQNIETMFVHYRVAGKVQPEPIMMPASYLSETVGDTGLGFLQISSHIMGRVVRAATNEISNHYKDLTPEEANEYVGISLMPTDFGFYVTKPEYVVEPREHVMGLTARQQGLLARTSEFDGKKLVNLDAKRNGYCLFETVSALSGVATDMLLVKCGMPAPKDVTVQGYADRLANITRINLRFFWAVKVGATPKMKEYYHTQTAYERTEDLFIMTVNDPSNPDESSRKYSHVFYIVDGCELKDTVPYEDETWFVSFDLETVHDEFCLNHEWALNVFTTRVVPTPVTSKIYNPAQLQLQMEFLNVESGQWYPLFVDSVSNGKTTRAINPLAKECAHIFYDAGLHALDNLMPYLLQVRSHHKGDKLHLCLVGFNSSRFDNFMLIPHLKSRMKLGANKVKVGIYGNSILTLDLALPESGLTVSTFDLRRHMAGSLRGNCRMWGVPEGAAKGDLDHVLIQTVYDIDNTVEGFASFIKANQKDIETYCKQDVIATASLHVIYKCSQEFIFNKYFIQKYGASLGMIVQLSRACATRDKDATPEAVGKLLARIGVSQRAMEIIKLIGRLPVGPEGYDTVPIDLSMIPVPDSVPETDCLLHDRAELDRLMRFHASPCPTEAEGSLKGLQELRKRLELKLWENVGGKFIKAKIKANIEEHPTLAMFATMLFKALTTARGVTLVGGFRYDITKLLRKHQCIAGRSEAHIGIHEDEPTFLLDVVSLYPTSMSSGVTEYAVGYKDSKGSDRVHCTYRTEFVKPVTRHGKTITRAGIWRVLVDDQPNGVVLPAKDSTGYYWDRDCAHGMYKLATTPDIVSLEKVHARFRIIDGITFDDASTEVYSEYISIFADEKTRQDALKSGKTTWPEGPLKGQSILAFPGETYSAGVREGTKLDMNILSGKEITRPYTSKKVIVDNGHSVEAADACNEQVQSMLRGKARESLERTRVDGIKGDLLGYRRKMLKAERIPRLRAPPVKLAEDAYVAEWIEVPKSSKYSHINGYHIYGTARQIMTQVYCVNGYKSFHVTETDSLDQSVSGIANLYDQRSVNGDPLLYIDTEIGLGLFKARGDKVPVRCDKLKHFGQMECETTEKLVGFFAELRFGKDTRMVKRLEYREAPPDELASSPKANHELVLNGERTGYFGPYIAVGGKKIYCQYLRTVKGEIVPLKAKFKGITMNPEHGDWILDSQYGVAPDLWREVKRLRSVAERIHFVLALADTRTPGAHRACAMDIFEFIKQRKLFVLQHRISETSTLNMTSTQQIVMKELTLRDDGPSSKGLLEIKRSSDEVRDMSLRAIARTIRSGPEDTDSLCQLCDAEGPYTVDFRSFCEAHRPSDDPPVVDKLCRHQNRFGMYDCGAVRTKGQFCDLHANYAHMVDYNIYCDHVDGHGRQCHELATAASLLKNLRRCAVHETEDETLPDVLCLRRYTYSKAGSYSCTEPACRRAIRSGYQLCLRHHINNVGANRAIYEHCKIDDYKMAELLKRLDEAKGPILQAAAAKEYAPRDGRAFCPFVDSHRKTCGKEITPPAKYCKRHAARASYLASRT